MRAKTSARAKKFIKYPHKRNLFGLRCITNTTFSARLPELRQNFNRQIEYLFVGKFGALIEAVGMAADVGVALTIFRRTADSIRGYCSALR